MLLCACETQLIRCSQFALQAIVDCGHASFRHYGENMQVWSEIREVCEDLLSTDSFGKFQELCDLDVFDTEGDDTLREDWGSFITKCDPEDEEMDASDFEREIEDRNDFYESSIDERARRIAIEQLTAWSVYVDDKPLAKAAYRDFLVSIVRLFFMQF